MYKGENKEFQKKLEELNQNSDFFYFSFGDLELCEISEKEGREDYKGTTVRLISKKYRLLSEELKKKLQEVISKNRPIYPAFDFIELGIHKDNEIFRINNYFFDGRRRYSSWLKFEKNPWVLLEKERTVSNNTLKLYFSSYNKLADTRGVIFWDVYKEKGEYEADRRMCEEKHEITETTRSSALTQIDQELTKNKIDITELGGVYFMRSDCLCDGSLNPEEEKKYHITHINKCLWRPDRVNQFKDEIIAVIRESKIHFDQKKEQLFQEIKKVAASKKVTLDLPYWKDKIFSQTNSADLTKIKEEILQLVEKLVTNSARLEEERQRIQAEFTRKKEVAKKLSESARKVAEAQAEQERQTAEKKVETESTKYEQETKSKIQQEEQVKSEQKQQEQNQEKIKEKGAKKQAEELARQQEAKLQEQLEQEKKNLPPHPVPNEDAPNEPDQPRQPQPDEPVPPSPTLPSEEPPNNSSPIVTIDEKEIIQTASISQAQTKAKEQISQLLTKHKLVTSQLPPEYQDWEKKITSLPSRAAAIAYSQEIARVINQLLASRDHSSNSTTDNSSNSLSPEILIWIFICITLGIILIIFARKINLQLKKKKTKNC